MELNVADSDDFRWRFNRYNRPSWATGLFVALACGVAGAGGVVSYVEGRRVKRVEGESSSMAALQDNELGLRPTTTEEAVIQVHEKDKLQEHR